MSGRETPYLGAEISYVNGNLHVEDVDLKALANGGVGTPVYVYSLALMKRRYHEFKTAMLAIDSNGLVCFGVKSLSNQTVLEEFARLGAGADLVTREIGRAHV